MDIERTQVQAFLANHFDPASSHVVGIGEGAWSQCFGFRRGDQELVIRFGQHVDDFRKDQLVSSYRSPDLPIPLALALGEAFDGYYAISTRVHGVALESVSAAQWQSIVPSLAAALEAMRLADVSATVGFGGWGGEGDAPHAQWSGHLLSVGDDTPDRRTHGWCARLAAFPQADAVFTWGFDRLKQVANDTVPRCLIHSDLINRNVLVTNRGLLASLIGVARAMATTSTIWHGSSFGRPGFPASTSTSCARNSSNAGVRWDMFHTRETND
jgi:hygromycin-B 4-O-kinase